MINSKRPLSSPENSFQPQSKTSIIHTSSPKSTDLTDYTLSDSAHLYSLPSSSSEDTIVEMAINLSANVSDHDMSSGEEYTDFICIEVL